MEANGDKPDDVAAVSNLDVSAALDDVSDLLEAQGANPFRVRAYRRAAATVRGLAQPVRDLLQQEGLNGLRRLPGIGQSLAHAIDDLVHTGSLPMLDRLRGEHAAEQMFATVADIGPKLAARIHETLGIETLAELEAAAGAGRLAAVPGMGEKRIQAVRETLAGRFHHRLQPPLPPPIPEQPPIEELLGVDREYRQRAQRNQLPKIAPKQFNPTGAAWLPVLHTVRADRHYTAMFSNTANAHRAGATHDWVVIYRDDDAHGGCWTVVTGGQGRLHGRRVVRGREQDCAAYYAEHARTQLELDFHDD
jgi:hypothetical protein